MGYSCYCDLCLLPIKETDEKYIFAINSTSHKDVQEEKQMLTLEDLQEAMLLHKKNVKSYEICSKCKRVLDYFINIRASKAKKIAEILYKLDKRKEIITLPEGENGNVKEK